MLEPQTDSKQLLKAWRGGDTQARDKLFDLLYHELQHISAALLRAEHRSSLSTGDLVNEAVLRLIRLKQIEWADKTHFLALSAKAMRQILIDHARRKNANKRHHYKVTLVTCIKEETNEGFDLDSLDAALIQLGILDEGKAQIVELRYFGGMSLQETAAVLGKSESTIKREWRIARAWLLDALTKANKNEHK